MYKVSFVILHYMSYEYTDDCISSILKNVDYDNYNIVIVDNNSTNDSFLKLQEKYKDNEKIYFIKNKENLGFAKGNNVGYRFAKYELKSDFIILLNNDTIIEQNDFINIIIDKFKETNFYVLGPDIVTMDGIHQNPHRMELINTKKILTDIIILSIKLLLTYIYLDGLLKFLKDKIKVFLSKKNNRSLGSSKFIAQDLTNVQLQGACLIFSPNYVKEFEGLYDKTFMYYEEEILFFTMVKEKKLTLYSPQIKVIHRVQGSTSYTFIKSNKKRRFILKNMLISCFIVLRYFINYHEEKRYVQKL